MTAFLILLLGSACAGTSVTENASTVYDPGPDIERFLDTADPAEEAQILTRLKESKVSHNIIKAYLRKSAVGSHGLSGLFPGIPVKHMGKELTYSLYIPESAQEGQLLPMIVIMHGMGGRGDLTLQSWRKRLKDSGKPLRTNFANCGNITLMENLNEL